MTTELSLTVGLMPRGRSIFVANRRGKISKSEESGGTGEVRLFILMRQTENAVAAKAHINAGRFQQSHSARRAERISESYRWRSLVVPQQR